MKTGARLIVCVLLGSVPLGCVPQTEAQPQTATTPELYALRLENDKLRKRIKELEAAADIQAKRAEEIARRDKQLTRKVTELQFEIERLRDQVRSLGKVPAERDRYRAEARKAKRRAAGLELELRRLRKQQTPPSSAPSRLPAGSGS